MNRIRIVVLTLALIATPFLALAALAQEPAATAGSGDPAYKNASAKPEDCTKYSAPTQRLQWVLCMQNLNQVRIARKLETVREELEALKAEKKAPPPSVAPPPPPAAPPAPTDVLISAPPLPPSPVGMRELPSRVVPIPGRAATTFEPDGGSWLWVYSMAAGADWHVPGAHELCAVITRDSIPIPIGHADGIFIPIFADLDGDGQVDRVGRNGPRRVYSCVDPYTTDDVYIANPFPGKFHMVYVAPMGVVETPGLPPEIFWGHPVKIRFASVDGPGRWKRSGSSGTRVYR